MEWPKLKNIYICFPGGRHKVLTMSFDDGRVEDRRLVELFNRYGVRGTFNLNAGLLLDDRVPPSEWRDLYRGHEVACHTCLHPTIARSPLDQVARQILRTARGWNPSWDTRCGAGLPQRQLDARDRGDAALAGHPVRPRRRRHPRLCDSQ